VVRFAAVVCGGGVLVCSEVVRFVRWCGGSGGCGEMVGVGVGVGSGCVWRWWWWWWWVWWLDEWWRRWWVVGVVVLAVVGS